MLTCLIAPMPGRATIMGHEVGQESQNIRRHVGLLTETPGMYDCLSAPPLPISSPPPTTNTPTACPKATSSTAR
jgi:hypothetical protein